MQRRLGSGEWLVTETWSAFDTANTKVSSAFCIFIKITTKIVLGIIFHRFQSQGWFTIISAGQDSNVFILICCKTKFMRTSPFEKGKKHFCEHTTAVEKRSYIVSWKNFPEICGGKTSVCSEESSSELVAKPANPFCPGQPQQF